MTNLPAGPCWTQLERRRGGLGASSTSCASRRLDDEHPAKALVGLRMRRKTSDDVLHSPPAAGGKGGLWAVTDNTKKTPMRPAAVEDAEEGRGTADEGRALGAP